MVVNTTQAWLCLVCSNLKQNAIYGQYAMAKFLVESCVTQICQPGSTPIDSIAAISNVLNDLWNIF